MATSALLEYATTANVTATLFILGVVGFIASAVNSPALPDFAWVGEGRGVWPSIKGNVTYMIHFGDWLRDGYTKVCRFPLARELP